MAAASSVNNIAATFSACKISAAAKPCLRPLASWNPQAQLPRALKSSFLGVYGGPGPKLLNLTSSANRSKTPTTSLNRSGFLACSSSSRRRFASASSIRAAAINVGDKLPDATLSYLDKDDSVQTVSVSDLTKGKKVVLVAVPGAFTPTCSQKHLPPFISKADDLRKKGIDTIACVSVNDAFVMKAWGQSLNVGGKVLLLADGNGEFTRALGVSLDLSDKPAGLGIRSRRYALVADDGVVKILKLEEGGAFTVSGADDILKEL